MIGAKFGIIALIPAMLNLTVVTAGETISVQICTSDGRTHTVQIPIGGQPGDPTSPALCCAKGCHTGGSRKRLPADN